MTRLSTYMGPKVQIQPHELERYENERWVAEEKHDGHWAEVTTNEEGKIVQIRGRSGKTYSNINVYGLQGLNIGLANSVFVSELEAGTEAANARYEKIGHTRLHVFDVVKLLGQDTTSLPYEKRRALLEMAFVNPTKRVLLVRQVTKGFKKFFESVTSQGGEGIVLKRVGVPYKPYGASGKTDNWVRCKSFHFVDYVVMEVGKSEGGSDNFQVGLYINGSLQRVATIKNIPTFITNPHAYVGRVIECKGAEVHKSGALRHGHFERVRDDKEPQDCTIECARNS